MSESSNPPGPTQPAGPSAAVGGRNAGRPDGAPNLPVRAPYAPGQAPHGAANTSGGGPNTPGQVTNDLGGVPNAGAGMRLPLVTLGITAVLVTAVVVAAVFAAPAGFRISLAVGGAVFGALLCAAVTAAAWYRNRIAQAGYAIEAERAQAAAARAETEAVRGEIQFQVEAAHAEGDARVASIIAEAQARIADSDGRIQVLHEGVAERLRAVKDSDNRRAAAMAAFAGAAGRMQAMSTSMLAELREMEHRHADPKVLADLLELDHRTAQAGRLADSLAVLSGARSGRRWAKPIAMESILRGAMGRVAGYQRVRLRAVAEIAIAGHAAEGVMHALAELLDNACNFSPPTTEVHVYAAEVPAGVVITIEDSGLVMSESALHRAELTVSGRSDNSTDLSSLSGTRLGLAVVGHLARKHDLTVSYRPSAIGGTAVVVVVPRELTTRLERPTGSLTALAPVPHTAIRTTTLAGQAATTTSSSLTPVTVTELPPTGLSQRTRGGAEDRAPVTAAGTGSAAAGTISTSAGPNRAAASGTAPGPEATFADHLAAWEATRATGGPAESGTPLLPGASEPIGALTGLVSESPATSGVFGGSVVQPPADSAHSVLAGSEWTSPDPYGRPVGGSPDSGTEAASGGFPVAPAAPTLDEIAQRAAGSTASGLPKRRRGQTLAAVHPQGLDAPAPAPQRPPASPSALGAFQRAVNGRENPGAAPSSPSLPSAPLETDR
ncbi:ATP-binding protein [Nocardia sp. NPDC020380]|uniref:sensor histidine kinase n=1 Tax=Nocardia sp. NPDC020380 TaxID=3364309 RepID=UPI00379FF84A